MIPSNDTISSVVKSDFRDPFTSKIYLGVMEESEVNEIEII